MNVATNLLADGIALEARDLTKSFGGVRVLEGLSFQVATGERLAIIGPNGAGKTTLLNMINGQIPPTSGKILFLDEDISGLPTHSRTQRGQSRSFQLCSLFQKLSVMENVLLVLNGLRKERFDLFHSVGHFESTWRGAEDLLRAAGLWERRDDAVERLPYGGQRRLEMLLCAATKPKLMLLDEPSNGLTKEEGRDVVAMIREQIGREVTVLIVAHDMELVFSVADRIMVLYEGEIIVCDSCDIVRCDPRVREIYMGA